LHQDRTGPARNRHGDRIHQRVSNQPQPTHRPGIAHVARIDGRAVAAVGEQRVGGEDDLSIAVEQLRCDKSGHPGVAEDGIQRRPVRRGRRRSVGRHRRPRREPIDRRQQLRAGTLVGADQVDQIGDVLPGREQRGVPGLEVCG
jgi:hypothetical protein